MESILCAIITGVLALAGVIVSNVASNKNIESQLKVSQAVTDTKLENLTREVREHNSFAQKIPVIEQRLETLEEELKNIKKGE